MTFFHSYSFKCLLTNVTSCKKATFKFLQQMEVIHSNMDCPGPLINGRRQGGCNNHMCLKETGDTKDMYVWPCRKKHKIVHNSIMYTVKDIKLSIRHSSWLVDTKLGLNIVLEIVYLWSQGFSVTEIIHELKVSKKTIIEWCHFLRECCTAIVLDYSTPIGGPGVEVEIDESKFGKRKYHKGHKVEGQWVFGGREKKDKSKIFMVPVCNRKKDTLLALIKKWILPGSIIHSDCWKAYSCLSKFGYTHVTVNHSKEFVNAETGACTNSIESDWRHAKLHMPKYGAHIGDHSGYLAKFMWRRKYHNCDKFHTLLRNINEVFSRKYLLKTPAMSS